MPRPPSHRHRAGLPLAGAVLAGLLAALSACSTADTGTRAYDAPGANTSLATGLDIADLHLAALEDDPVRPGTDALLLAGLRSRGPGDRLVAASSPISGDVELRRGARTVEAIAIPAGELVVLRPDGPHVVLRDVDRIVREGSWVPVTLTFERAGEITVQVPRRVDNDDTYPRGTTPP